MLPGEFQDWAAGISLAFWDVKQNHSAHFLSLLGKYPTGIEYISTNNSKWIPLDEKAAHNTGSGLGGQPEYVAFNDHDMQDFYDFKSWQIKLADKINPGYAVVSLIVNVVDVYELAEGIHNAITSSPIPGENPLPRLHRGEVEVYRTGWMIAYGNYFDNVKLGEGPPSPYYGFVVSIEE